MRRHAEAPNRTRLTPRDFELLGFLAEHRLILAGHAQRLLGASSSVAYARLRALSAAGLVRREATLHGQPSCYLATASGIRAASKSYRSQEVDHALMQHDLGIASLWLVAREGTFGPVHELISERAMRSHDRTADDDEPPIGVRLGGVGEAGRQRLHYPDLMLVTPAGKRVAFELELSSKGAARRSTILMGYAFDRRIDAVVYLVRDRSTGRRIQDSARRAGLADLVHVQLVTGLPRAGGRGRIPERVVTRAVQEHAR